MRSLKPVLSAEALILFISVYITIVCNITFWSEILSRLDITTIEGFGYLLTSFFIILLLTNFLLLIFSHKTLIKPTLVFVLIFCSIVSYFNHKLGIVFDKEMIRNIVDNINENNVREAEDLLSLPLFLYVFIVGVIPSMLVTLVTINHGKTLGSYRNRIFIIASIFFIAAFTFKINYKFFTYFYRQNEDTLVYINPIYPLVAVKKYVKRRMKDNYTFNDIGNDAYQDKNNKRKEVGILLVGETARADRFSLNGYQRQTNPELSKIKNLISFTNVHSCGTSTAYSVPCMFSFLDHSHYSPEKAQHSSNVLDVLKKANINVIWEENNSSCKGVCKRIEEINFINKSYPESKSEAYKKNYDEIMLDDLNNSINNTNQDVLIVLHTMGSHGPKYFERYPESAAVFKPYCKKASPEECNKEEINNAYDNTIIYTDYFLSQVIELLKQHENDYDAFMVYVSDHGESLGENGVYLHGLPNFIAPDAQTHIPFILWFSDNFIMNNNLDMNVIKHHTTANYTHDNLSHTLLGLFGIKTKLYEKSLDTL